jgi:hypothetical protein
VVAQDGLLRYYASEQASVSAPEHPCKGLALALTHYGVHSRPEHATRFSLVPKREALADFAYGAGGERAVATAAAAAAAAALHAPPSQHAFPPPTPPPSLSLCSCCAP